MDNIRLLKKIIELENGGTGATEEQINQIEANKTAIGDENSGLIKDVNDLKTKLILSEENKTRLSEAASILEELNR